MYVTVHACVALAVECLSKVIYIIEALSDSVDVT